MPTETRDLTAMTPAEVDSLLFPLVEQIAHREASLLDYRYLLGEIPKRDTFTRTERWNKPGVQKSSFEEGKQRVKDELAELNSQADPLEAEYQRRPWTRYLVVPGGHLHKRSCHTLTPGRTMVGQDADSSGLTAEQVIAKYNVTACTHCFPDAPVEPKKTPAEEGLCEHSGEYVASRLVEEGTLSRDWVHRMVAPTVTCKCGWRGAITKGGKLRRHKVPA